MTAIKKFPHGIESKLIFFSLGRPSARKLSISLRAVVRYFKNVVSRKIGIDAVSIIYLTQHVVLL